MIYLRYNMRRKLQDNNYYSLSAVIPKEIVEDMGLKVGDILDIVRKDDYIIARPVHTNRQVENVQAQAQEPIKVGEPDD
jgi:AbrB family looped-hinge helix DNA binding protein